jgi:2-polyprenyl-6-methoxyphenol hydroxylase-like FAD-dependent oxidoreductase
MSIESSLELYSINRVFLYGLAGGGMKITIIGGGAGGLFAALLLARAGHELVMLEQDRMEPAADVESAAGSAYRPTAPQIVQPHAVMARCRELVRDRLPDV